MTASTARPDSSPGARRTLTIARARGSRMFADPSTAGASMPSTAIAGLWARRSVIVPVPRSSTPSSSPASPRKVSSSVSGTSEDPTVSPATATSPLSSCSVASRRHRRGQGVARGAAEHPGVHRALEHRDLDDDVRQATQARGERGDVDGGVGGVGDHDDVGREGVAVLGEQRGQRRRPGLLLALDEQQDAHRRPSVEGPQGGEVGHHAGLVVGGPAPVQAAVALVGLEGRRGPQLVAAGGLDVVVRVEHDGRGVRRGRASGRRRRARPPRRR